MALACADDPSSVSGAKNLGKQSEPIFGTYCTDDGSDPCTEDGAGRTRISRAERLDTPHGVQGAVGLLTAELGGVQIHYCSGTLVSPKHFVTAGHCLFNWADMDGSLLPEGSVYVSFPQAPEKIFQEAEPEPGGEPTRHVWNYNGFTIGGTDLAIITLRTSVPRHIVNNYPKFNTGDVGDFIDSVSPGDFLIAGFGLSGVDEHEELETQERNFGFAASVHWNTQYPGSTNPPQIDVGYSLQKANSHDGDSGGPLFGRDPATNEFVLVGVLSGGDLDREGKPSWYAFLGTSQEPLPHNPYNHDLRDYMGPDLDGDGILDIIDNCPPALCTAIGDGRSCVNPDQADYDGDGVGDICDICPLSATSEDQHPEGKTIGSECGCGDMEYLSCTHGSTICKDHGAGTCLFDYDLDGNPLPGLCSSLEDRDADGLPDKCDTCPDTWDPQDLNSNLHIERELDVDPFGDVCDGVPLFPFVDVPTPVSIDSIPTPGNGSLGVDVQALRGYPWLGEESDLSTSFQLPVKFRHCGCVDELGNEVDPEDCADSLCRPSGAEHSENRWVRATTSATPSGLDFPSNGFPAQFDAHMPASDPTEGEDPFPPPGEQDTLYWKSYQDIQRQSDPVQGQGASSYGLMASVVHDQGIVASERDQTYRLRTSLTAMKTPSISVLWPKPDVELVEEIKPLCEMIDCFELISFPMKPDLPLQPYPVDPLAVLVRDGLAGMLLRDGGFADVTQYLDPALVEALSRGDWTILSAIESSNALRTAGIDQVGVMIPREGSLGLKPIPIFDDNGTIRLRGTPAYAPNPGQLSDSMQLRQGEKAVYSAMQDRIFFAGGSSSLRTYDVGLDRYQEVPLDRGLSVTVGGLALDTIGNKVYTLEVEWMEEYAKDMATIFEYDIHAGRSRLLFTVPWTGTYDRTALVADTENTLILMGSKGNLTESWRFLLSEGGGAEQIGNRVDEGRLFNEPHHSTRSAVMILNDNLFIREIHHGGFFEGESLDLL